MSDFTPRAEREFTLWIYSLCRERWTPMYTFGYDDLDEALRIAQAFQHLMQWAIRDYSGLQYWRKGDDPEAVIAGIADAMHAKEAGR